MFTFFRERLEERSATKRYPVSSAIKVRLSDILSLDRSLLCYDANMCSYANYPYTIGAAARDDNPLAILSEYVFTTPIRDEGVCLSESEPYVVLVGSGAESAYVDLSVVAVHLVLLSILLVGLPLLWTRTVKKRGLAIVSSVCGVLFSAFIIAATINSPGRELVIPWMIIAGVVLLTPSYWIYQKAR